MGRAMSPFRLHPGFAKQQTPQKCTEAKKKVLFAPKGACGPNSTTKAHLGGPRYAIGLLLSVPLMVQIRSKQSHHYGWGSSISWHTQMHMGCPLSPGFRKVWDSLQGGPFIAQKGQTSPARDPMHRSGQNPSGKSQKLSGTIAFFESWLGRFLNTWHVYGLGAI